MKAESFGCISLCSGENKVEPGVLRSICMNDRRVRIGIVCVVAGMFLSNTDLPRQGLFPAKLNAAQTADRGHRNSDIRALQPLSVLVGQWRAVGQPQRGSNVGAWSEELSAAWDFTDDQAKLIVSSKVGKQFQKLILVSSTGSEDLILRLQQSGQPEQTLNRTAESSVKDTFIFSSANDESPGLRCTIRRISDIRVTILFEQRTSGTGSFRRIAELGCTRAGEKLARGNAGERQCIVTGGLGTISVSHAGMTFYVCCEGCRQAFQDDPEGTIAAYRERLKESQLNESK